MINEWGPPVRFTPKGREFVVTWKGQPETQPDDYARFASHGYRANSLIYACMREKATSYAGLPFALSRKTPDGDELRTDSQVIELLENPSVEMDGDEFKATISTHLDGAGNVYIQKLRQSRDFPERRSWPVPELRLIRPDYVEIEPGISRSTDMFAVKIDGKVKARIPRRDMIHVKENDPSNDYYGLSKIAVIAREGDLDQRMTDFDRAFFMNAGVPMGILTANNNLTPAEKTEVRNRFRRALQGIGKWFDLLVLNAQEAKYQQLGIPQSDMEAEATRMLVESRICAVFGVPAVLIGAFVGLKHAADRANYQTGLFQFWTETMIPLAKFFGSAFTRELLPEFATPADRGWRITSDFTGIDALEKDNSTKVTAAAALLREVKGYVPLNQVLGLVGLPMLEGGDVMAPAPPPMIDATPLEERRSYRPVRISEPVVKSLPDRMISQRLLIADDLTIEMSDFLADQGIRVEVRLTESNKQYQRVDSYIPQQEDELLRELVMPHLAEALASGWRLASDAVRIDPAFDVEDPVFQKMLERAGGRITGITETTRADVSAHLQVAEQRGYSLEQIVQGVPDDDYPALRDISAFGESRARMIARTEVSAAQNLASAQRWRQSGLVERVHIVDGDLDGPCAEANGATWTLDEYESNPQSHPNCIRAAIPILEGDSE